MPTDDTHRQRLAQAARRWSKRLRGPTARQSAWAVLDRIVIGVTNFVIGLTLARYSAPSEYGAYVLAFAMLLFYEDLQGKLIGLPMTVIGAAKDAHEFPRYVSTILLVQMLAGGLLTLLSFAVANLTS